MDVETDNSRRTEDDMDVDSITPERIGAVPRKRPPSRPTTPDLPLSPISNPSSPQRKRPRQLDWEPPEYIPDFLPPFPSMKEDTPGSPVPDHAPIPLPQFPMPIPAQISDAAAEKTTMTLSQSLITAAASDFLVRVPYSQSSLAAISDRHLPSPLPPPVPPTWQNNPPTLQIEPSLLGAYHHILTHPPPRELPSLNPSRHKIAMALINQGQANPRYNPADTLFGSVAPCPPRVSTIGPSYPIPIGDTSNSDKNKDGKDKDVKLPQSIPRPVSSIERIASFITQQSSQIPDLALRVLPVGSYQFLNILWLNSFLTPVSPPSTQGRAAYHIHQSFSAVQNRLSMAQVFQLHGIPTSLGKKPTTLQAVRFLRTALPPAMGQRNRCYQTRGSTPHGIMTPKTLGLRLLRYQGRGRAWVV
jgi:hypothetical protein